jgi:hypothetical protein
MTTQSPSLANAAAIPARHSDQSGDRLLSEIVEFWRTFIKAAFDPYHPEQHYMRGPGPACAAKRNLNRS